MNTTIPRNTRPQTALTAWIAETRYEAIRMARTPGYFVPMLVLPPMFFLLFAVAMGGNGSGPNGARYMLAGYGAFGTLAAAILGLAGAVAVEREKGLLVLKRAWPLPPGAYLGAKVLTAMLIASVSNGILALLAATLGHVQLAAGQWLAVFAANVLGVLPFAALGLFIGSVVSASAAPGIANLAYLPMSFLSGLWFPLEVLPPMLRGAAHWLPSYHFVQLPLHAVGLGDGSALLPHLAVLVVFAAVFFWLALRRLGSEGATAQKPSWRGGLRIVAVLAAAALAQHYWPRSASSAAAAGLTPADQNSFAIENVRVFDGEHLIPQANVVVRDGRIAAVGADIEIPKGLPVVTGKGRTLLPGLIDAHTHSFGDARRQALRFGVTTELDMFTDWHTLAAARQQRGENKPTAEADLWSAGTLATAPHGHGTEYGLAIPTIERPEQAEAFVRDRIAEGSDYLKLILEDGSAYGHTLPTLDTPTVQSLVMAAHARQLLTVAHVSTEAEAAQAFDAGVDGLAHVFLDQDASAELLAKAKGHFVTATLSVAASAGGRDEGSKLADDPALQPFLDAAQAASLRARFGAAWIKPALFDHALENVRRLHATGVPILAGTDAGNPGTAHGASLHGELALLVRAGLTPAEALRAATALPARIFHLDDRGRIAPGLKADLLLVEGDPLQDITATRAIAGLWKNGYAVARTLTAEERGDTGAAPKADADPLLADFEQGEASGRQGQAWQTTTDQLMGGRSTASQHWQAGGAENSKGALAVEGEVQGEAFYAWAGTTTMLGRTPMQPVDFSGRRTLRFRFKGDGRRYNVMLFSGADPKGRPQLQPFESSRDWQEVSLPLQGFSGADLGHLRAIAVTAGQPAGHFAFLLDEVRVE